jgi:hypothetical protein
MAVFRRMGTRGTRGLVQGKARVNGLARASDVIWHNFAVDEGRT